MNCIFCHCILVGHLGQYCIMCDAYYYLNSYGEIATISLSNHINYGNKNISIYIDIEANNIRIFCCNEELCIVNELFWLFPHTYVAWAQKYINMRAFA